MSSPILIPATLALLFATIVCTELVKAILRISGAVVISLSRAISDILLVGSQSLLSRLLNVAVSLGLCLYDIAALLLFVAATFGPLIVGFLLIRSLVLGVRPLRFPWG
ncbi:uncharacterized protein F4812DRAFT_170798 [Daldinia caldariorum]|uniref:uncharacterized protein n=1 Tax=Daldinia caldariorum TaxID=326644 RepID=UPI0020086798|nr:uncharacterized protein F4812DRAFT_170798 [Daldinia caldariorum]KAI1471226.1 hypothetical protein F4812DRAFT_170798 [Daldinia caldariorum]